MMERRRSGVRSLAGAIEKHRPAVMGGDLLVHTAGPRVGFQPWIPSPKLLQGDVPGNPGMGDAHGSVDAPCRLEGHRTRPVGRLDSPPVVDVDQGAVARARLAVPAVVGPTMWTQA